MATVRKCGRTWRAEVWSNGVGESQTFASKGQASAWAAAREEEILAGKPGLVPKKTLHEALARYADEESPKHRGEHWERGTLVGFGG